MQSLILDMPREAGAQLNYLSVLASCENYQIPTCPNMSVEELISNKIYSWYSAMIHFQDQQEVSYFMNYE